MNPNDLHKRLFGTNNPTGALFGAAPNRLNHKPFTPSRPPVNPSPAHPSPGTPIAGRGVNPDFAIPRPARRDRTDSGRPRPPRPGDGRLVRANPGGGPRANPGGGPRANPPLPRSRSWAGRPGGTPIPRPPNPPRASRIASRPGGGQPHPRPPTPRQAQGPRPRSSSGSFARGPNRGPLGPRRRAASMDRQTRKRSRRGFLPTPGAARPRPEIRRGARQQRAQPAGKPRKPNRRALSIEFSKPVTKQSRVLEVDDRNLPARPRTVRTTKPLALSRVPSDGAIGCHNITALLTIPRQNPYNLNVPLDWAPTAPSKTPMDNSKTPSSSLPSSDEMRILTEDEPFADIFAEMWHTGHIAFTELENHYSMWRPGLVELEKPLAPRASSEPNLPGLPRLQLSRGRAVSSPNPIPVTPATGDNSDRSSPSGSGDHPAIQLGDLQDVNSVGKLTVPKGPELPSMPNACNSLDDFALPVQTISEDTKDEVYVLLDITASEMVV